MTSKWASIHLSNQLLTPALEQQVIIIDNLVSSKTPPKSSASATASLVESQHDISLALANLVGLYFSAAESCTRREERELLAAYLIELAKQPDAVNPGPETKIWDAGGGEIRKIEVGKAIVVQGRRLWSDLPEFGWNLTEIFQGPELWTHDLRNPATPEVAAAKWKDINTLIALVAHHPDAQTIPVLARYISMGRVTLVMALENSPGTRLEKNTAMHVPAAAQWFSIAGEEMERMCEAGTESMKAGDLWKEQGGSDVCNVERLKFWKNRLAELGY